MEFFIRTVNSFFLRYVRSVRNKIPSSFHRNCQHGNPGDVGCEGASRESATCNEQACKAGIVRFACIRTECKSI